MKYISSINGVPGSAAVPGKPAPGSLRDCAALVQSVSAVSAVLAISDLQAYWLSVMADRRVPARDRLAASRMYAESVGAFDARSRVSASTSGAVRWIEAETVDAAPAAGSSVSVDAPSEGEV